MSNNRLVWDGLSEFRAELRQLPSELTGDAVSIVDNTTETTASSLTQVYPLGDSGDLRGGVKKELQRTQFGVVGVVKSTSPHSHLWEFGTAVRRTSEGWNRGKMPSQTNDGLVSIAQRNRRRMHGELIELVRRAGFDVSGSL